MASYVLWPLISVKKKIAHFKMTGNIDLINLVILQFFFQSFCPGTTMIGELQYWGLSKNYWGLPKNKTFRESHSTLNQNLWNLLLERREERWCQW